MSVSGRWSTPFHGECNDNDAVDRVLHPLRMTPSASPARRGERGVRAILASFPLQTQLSLRRLLSERFMIEAKLRAAKQRLEMTANQPTIDTDDMRKLALALKDSNYNIKRLVGADAMPHLLALFGEPDVNSGMTLCVATEEDARTTYDEPGDGEKAARGWRLTLGSAGHRVGLASQYRYVSHDSPNHKGQRTLINRLNSATGEEGLSYYQGVQIRHGRTRRGSCSYAGVHDEVFGPGGVMRPAPEPTPIFKSPRSGDNESTVSWGQRSASRGRILTSAGSLGNTSPSAAFVAKEHAQRYARSPERSASMAAHGRVDELEAAEAALAKATATLNRHL